jgi:hypothetical protein
VSIYVDCPVDMNAAAATAVTQVLSDRGFPVAATRSAALAVCRVAVDEGMQTLDAGTFYTPRVTVTLEGKTGPLSTWSAAVERVGARNPVVAKERAYTALVAEIREHWTGLAGTL